MQKLEWDEECGNCGSQMSAVMDHQGGGEATCGFCGRIEQWMQPDDLAAFKGGVGCFYVVVGDAASYWQGMTRRRLAREERALRARGGVKGVRGRVDRAVLTIKMGGGLWRVTAAMGSRSVYQWVLPKNLAQVVAELLTRGTWAENIRVRLAERRLAGGAWLKGFGRATARNVGEGAATGERGGSEEAEWSDLPF